jgi:RNA polymerase sigma-70 factor (sigma-E family)
MPFEEFVAARLPALLRYAYLLTGDRQVAHDVVQDALVKALVRWRRIRGLAEPYAYVRTMVTNEYLSGLRKRRRQPSTPLDPEVLHGRLPAQPDAADAHADRSDLWPRLAKLPRQQRAVIVLRFYEGLPDPEIAEVLGCRTGTVRGYASRALAALRVDLADGRAAAASTSKAEASKAEASKAEASKAETSNADVNERNPS